VQNNVYVVGYVKEKARLEQELNERRERERKIYMFT
jgi:hypothetical protein